MSMPRREPEELPHQPEHALAAGHGRHRAQLQRDQRTARQRRRAPRPARRVRRDHGVDDQLADLGDERRQRGGDHA